MTGPSGNGLILICFPWDQRLLLSLLLFRRILIARFFDRTPKLKKKNQIKIKSKVLIRSLQLQARLKYSIMEAKRSIPLILLFEVNFVLS